jgi:hypothetical protein
MQLTLIATEKALIFGHNISHTSIIRQHCAERFNSGVKWLSTITHGGNLFVAIVRTIPLLMYSALCFTKDAKVLKSQLLLHHSPAI